MKSVLMMDGLEVDVYWLVEEHVVNDIGIVDDFVDMVDEVFSIALLEDFELTHFVVGELGQQVGIVGRLVIDALSLIVVRTFFLGQIGFGCVFRR
jgi:hypothetical protein